VSRYSGLVVEMEVVVFQPVNYRMGSSGGTSALRKGTLPPHVMCVEVTHEDAVFWELDVIQN
jgi:hypothetical protein